MERSVEASVIIPNFNGKHLLDDCLISLQKQTFKNFEVIVVDNNSTDGSIDYIEDNYKEVRVVSLDKNYGFAKAINQGVKNSKAEYVVFLNNDTKANEDWLENLIKTVKKYPDVISASSKLLNFYHPSIIDGLGININEVGQAKSIGWNEKDEGQYDKLTYIFGATGGAALFNRKDFIKVGIFDEDYFMYSEEVDFAFRAQFLGYKSICCPTAVVYHKHKATAAKKPQHIEYWQFKNMTQTIIKDFPTSVLLKNWRWLKIILVHFNTIFYQLKNGFFWPPLAAEIWLIIHLPKLLMKRWGIQQTRKVPDKYIESFLLPKRITFWKLIKKDHH